MPTWASSERAFRQRSPAWSLTTLAHRRTEYCSCRDNPYLRKGIVRSLNDLRTAWSQLRPAQRRDPGFRSVLASVESDEQAMGSNPTSR